MMEGELTRNCITARNITQVERELNESELSFVRKDGVGGVNYPHTYQQEVSSRSQSTTREFWYNILTSIERTIIEREEDSRAQLPQNTLPENNTVTNIKFALFNLDVTPSK